VSQSTCTFIERIAPVSEVRMDKKRGCLVVRVAGGEYQCGNDGLWLKQNETGYVPIDPVPFKITLVNRAAMREVKKQYAAFMQYAVGLGKLTQWEKPEGEGVGSDTDNLLSAMRSDDIEDWAMAYRKLMWGAGVERTHYDYQTNRWHSSFVCDKKRLDARLTHMVKQVHASEVLVSETLPLGQHKKDPNNNYRRN